MKTNTNRRKKSNMTGWRSWFSREEWMIRLLGLKPLGDRAEKRGLLLIQIDGLGRRQLDKAMKAGYMPFLQSLVRQERYRVQDVYSGIPSNTPSFQGEFFYGQKQAVPAFHYYDRNSERKITMYEYESARNVEARLAEKEPGKGLLRGGSCYGNILSGAASEPHICAASSDWRDMIRTLNPYPAVLTFLVYPTALMRTVWLFLCEMVLAVKDFLAGVLQKKKFVEELKFIPTRIFVSILIRELIASRAALDLRRGLSRVQVNFFGYDEQAHRRGPETRFAFWTLGGIDSAIRRLYRSASRACRRDYDVWVYSDHGQESVTPHEQKTGKSLETWIRKALSEDEQYVSEPALFSSERLLSVYRNIGDNLFARGGKERKSKNTEEDFVVTAMGPVGHVYFTHSVAPERLRKAAAFLAKKAMVPLVVIPDRDDHQHEAWIRFGRRTLPEDVDEILGYDHPWRKEIREDLNGFLQHPGSGDLVLFGWAYGFSPLSFSNEHGAHAGLGPNETSAFALLPGFRRPLADGGSCRALHLRELAENVLGEKGRAEHRESGSGRIRVLTYNVHSCVGMDGRCDVKRIAEVIAESGADIVCLQELDSGRRFVDGLDQAGTIARHLEMNFHFHPVYEIEDRRFGNAILSRFPMKKISETVFLRGKKKSYREPRGVIGVRLEFEDRSLIMLTTHLSFWPGERERQSRDLETSLEELIGNAEGVPVILCGDFNMSRRTRTYHEMTRLLHDAAASKPAAAKNLTWPSRIPVRCLDYIFFQGGLVPKAFDVLYTHKARAASDHCPVYCEFELANSPASGEHRRRSGVAHGAVIQD